MLFKCKTEFFINLFADAKISKYHIQHFISAHYSRNISDVLQTIPKFLCENRVIDIDISVVANR